MLSTNLSSRTFYHLIHNSLASVKMLNQNILYLIWNHTRGVQNKHCVMLCNVSLFTLWLVRKWYKTVVLLNTHQVWNWIWYVYPEVHTCRQDAKCLVTMFTLLRSTMTKRCGISTQIVEMSCVSSDTADEWHLTT